MNMNWKNKMNRRSIVKPKGFTLIEFLVASALAIIVISAAGGTYFMRSANWEYNKICVMLLRC